MNRLGWLLPKNVARSFGLLLCVVVLAGCQSISVKSLPTSVVLPELGKSFKGQIDIAGKQIPLPDGVFALAGTRIQPNQKGGFNLSVMLVDVNNNNRLTSAVELYTNLRLRRENDAGEPRPGWTTHSSCNRDDMHFVELINNERLGNQDCWWVNHWRMARGGSLGKAEHWEQARKYLADNKVYAPMEMIGISYRLANADDFITMNVFKNTEEAGFTPALDDNWVLGTWTTSVWHPDMVKLVPRKKSYIDKQVTIGREFHSRLVNAFR